MADFSQSAVDAALKGLGNYRVLVAQELASTGSPDPFSGALLLALGLRESRLTNINNPAETDHGCFQISELYHADFLQHEPGCPARSWTPVTGHTAVEDGYCPRFTPACAYALMMLKSAHRYALGKDITDPLRFAIAAYNAGFGGATRGWREGDVDRYTTGGDYSAWVLGHRRKVNIFLNAHENWSLA